MTAPEAPPTVTRLFLLDDHEIVRRGLSELLNSVEDFEVVGEAGTVAEALRRMPAASARRRDPGRPAARRQRHRGLPGHPRGAARTSAA